MLTFSATIDISQTSVLLEAPKLRDMARQYQAELQNTQTEFARVEFQPQANAQAIEEPQCCRLLELPAELRLEVYEYVATSNSPVSLYYDQELFVKGSSVWATLATPILQACKQIRKEAFDIVWDNIIFDIMAVSLECDDKSMYRSLGQPTKCPVINQMHTVNVYFSPKHYHYDSRVAVFLERLRQLYDLLRNNHELKLLTFDCDASRDGHDTAIDGAFERDAAVLFKDAYDELVQRRVRVKLVNVDMNDQTRGCRDILLAPA